MSRNITLLNRILLPFSRFFTSQNKVNPQFRKMMDKNHKIFKLKTPEYKK